MRVDLASSISDLGYLLLLLFDPVLVLSVVFHFLRHHLVKHLPPHLLLGSFVASHDLGRSVVVGVSEVLLYNFVVGLEQLAVRQI